jgi:xanthine dehydrogenase molybdopterin-binding subunit B
MDRKNPMFGYGNDLVVAVGSLVGGGNGAGLVLASNAAHARIANFAVSGARTGEGVYDVVLAGGVPEILAVIPTCEGAGHRAEVTTAYVPSTRTVVITTRDAAGTADDLPTTSTLILTCICRDSRA